MPTARRLLIVLVTFILLFSSVGSAMAAPQAQNCRTYHVVRPGETLSSIAYGYGVYWPYLAQINNIRAPRYTVFVGKSLCIPTWNGGWFGTGGPYTNPNRTGGVRTWSYSITSVTANTSVTIQTSNLPNWVTFNVRMGRYVGGSVQWVNLPNLATQAGGSRTLTFTIPDELKNVPQLILRLQQVKKNGRVFVLDQAFLSSGGNFGTGGPYQNYPPYGYYGVPTIWVVKVQANKSVTIQTQNFPPGVTFDVLMGPIGTQGVGGVSVGTLNSNNGGTMTATFNIPAQLQGLRQIAIRTQNWRTGYHSYNWFNNSTY